MQVRGWKPPKSCATSQELHVSKFHELRMRSGGPRIPVLLRSELPLWLWGKVIYPLPSFISFLNLIFSSVKWLQGPGWCLSYSSVILWLVGNHTVQFCILFSPIVHEILNIFHVTRITLKHCFSDCVICIILTS